MRQVFSILFAILNTYALLWGSDNVRLVVGVINLFLVVFVVTGYTLLGIQNRTDAQ